MAKNLKALKMTDAMCEFNFCLDTHKMKGVFQQRLPECVTGDWELHDCSIQHPRYKTYLNPESRDKSFLSLAYHLNGWNRLSNQLESKIVYAHAYLGKRSYAEYEKAQANASQDRRKSIIHIPDFGMLGWIFPYDPVLTGLPELFDSSNGLSFFSGFGLHALQSDSDKLAKVTTRIINYRPELRCTLRYTQQTKEGSESVLFAKIYADDRGHAIYRRINSIWQRSLNTPKSFVIAQPLSYDKALRTLWLEGLFGTSVVKSIVTGHSSNLIDTIADGIADLHRLQLPDLETVDAHFHLSEARKKTVKLISAFPHDQPRLTRIIDWLEEYKPCTTDMPVSMIHGDFHLEQLLLLETGRIALFDFDELALGDPLQDPANFCADLYNHDFTHPQIQDLIAQFVDAYRSNSGNTFSFARFDWHLRLQLLTRAYRAYIQQKPNLEQVIHQFLEAAESGYADKQRGQSDVQ